MTGAALGAVAQGLSHLGGTFSSAHDLLSNQMSRRLKVRRKFDALGKMRARLLVRHGPGVPTLRAASHLRATMSTPPTNPSHVGKRNQPVVTVRMADWAFPTSAAALVAGLVPGLSNPPARAPQGSTQTTSGDGITPRHIGS